MSRLEFSVLLSVYVKENPKFLEQALQSVVEQSVLPNEIVIVKDGPLTNELDYVVHDFVESNRKVNVKVVELYENIGLGGALNIGLEKCKYDWVARMDSDDISKFDRFELMLHEIRSSENISVIGSYIDEFKGNPENVVQVRKVRLENSEIVNDVSTRNPMNHVSVFFKKDDVLSVGSYDSVLFFEDYHLWTKMMLKNMSFKNIPISTVSVRIGDDMIGRRQGVHYANLEFNFQRYLLRISLITKGKFVRNIFLRVSVRLLPKFMLNQIYVLSRYILG